MDGEETFFVSFKPPRPETRPFEHQDLEMSALKLNCKYVFFHPLEVLVRGSEIQVQVGINLNYLI